jgi:hypothetical protein
LLFAIIGVERKRARDQTLGIGRREPVRIEQPSLHAIIETGHDAQRVLRRRAVDDVTACQQGERTETRAGAQKVAARRLGEELGRVLGKEPGIDVRN